MSTLSARLRTLPHERPVVSLGSAIVAVELVGASGAIFTAQGLEAWYGTLQHPALAPPNWVFGPVWTVLFALVGVALWLVWRRADAAPRATRLPLAVFAVHLAVNVGWSVVFFGRQDIAGGLVVIGALWILILATMWTFDRVDRRATILLVPYLLWVTFAAYLNYRFWVLN